MKEFKNLIWAVAVTVLIYLYLVYKTAPETSDTAATLQEIKSNAGSQTLTSYAEANVGGKIVKLVDVNREGSVILSIDGRLAIVRGSELIDGLKITVANTFYSEKREDRAATLIIEQAD